MKLTENRDYCGQEKTEEMLNVELRNGIEFDLDLSTEYFNANETEIRGKENIRKAVKSLLSTGALPSEIE